MAKRVARVDLRHLWVRILSWTRSRFANRSPSFNGADSASELSAMSGSPDGKEPWLHLSLVSSVAQRDACGALKSPAVAAFEPVQFHMRKTVLFQLALKNEDRRARVHELRRYRQSRRPTADDVNVGLEVRFARICV